MFCTHCGNLFSGRTRVQKFCSDRCRYRARDLANRYPCATCGTLIQRGRDTLPPGVSRCKPCWRGASPRKGRAAYVPRKLRDEIYGRDGSVCGICDEPVDLTLPWNDDWAPTLDHILPRSRGGDESPANLRLAHRWCNTVRSNHEWLTLSDA